jgi:hypothetical protein
LHKKEPEP